MYDMLNKDGIELVRICCARCNVLFYITKDHYDKLVATNKSFYCPNGHSNYYDVKTPKEKIAEVRKEATRYKEYYSNQLDTTNRLRKEISTKKGQITKLKNKIKAINQ